MAAAGRDGLPPLPICFRNIGLLTYDNRFATVNTRKVNRPPPYFPQNQLSPPDEKRYRRFKLTVAAIAFVLVLIVVGAAYGIYYLIGSLL